MKNTAILFSLFILFSSAAICKKDKKTFMIQGQLTTTESWCGGMRPTPEIEKNLRIPKALPNTKIYIRKGTVNDPKSKIIQTVTSDANGNFSVKLPAGKYVIVDEKKKDRKYAEELLKKFEKETQNYSAIDKNCLEEWLKTPDFTFEIDANGTLKNMDTLKVNYHLPCSFRSVPCVQYRGPMPP